MPKMYLTVLEIQHLIDACVLKSAYKVELFSSQCLEYYVKFIYM